jgi:hypothetical protein
MTTDFLATLRELRAYRHRRVVERARQIVARDKGQGSAEARRESERQLDEALANSFPASDPIALSPPPISP